MDITKTNTMFEQQHQDFVTEKGIDATDIATLSDTEKLELAQQIDRYKANLEKSKKSIEAQEGAERADGNMDDLEQRAVESIKNKERSVKERLQSLKIFLGTANTQMEASLNRPATVEEFIDRKKGEFKQTVKEKISEKFSFAGKWVQEAYDWATKEDTGLFGKLFGGAVSGWIIGKLGLDSVKSEMDELLDSEEAILERIKPVGKVNVETSSTEDGPVLGQEGGDEGTFEQGEEVDQTELSEEIVNSRKTKYSTITYKMLEQFSGESLETNKTLEQVIKKISDKKFLKVQVAYLKYEQSQGDIDDLLSTLGLFDEYGEKDIAVKEKIASSLISVVGINANFLIKDQLNGSKFTELVSSPKFTKRFGEEYKEDLLKKGVTGLTVTDILVLFSYSIPGKMLVGATNFGESMRGYLFAGRDFGQEMIKDFTADREKMLPKGLLETLLTVAKDSSNVLGDSDEYKKKLLESGEHLGKKDIEALDKFIEFKNSFITSVEGDANIGGFDSFKQKFKLGMDANKLVTAFLAFNGNGDIESFNPLEKLSLYYWVSDVLEVDNENRAFITYIGKKIIESRKGNSDMFSEEESYFIISNLIRHSKELFDIFLSPGSWGRNAMVSGVETMTRAKLSDYEYAMIGVVIGLPIAAIGSMALGPVVRIAMGGISIYGVTMLLSKLNDEGTLSKALKEGSGLDESKRDLLSEMILENNIRLKD